MKKQIVCYDASIITGDLVDFTAEYSLPDLDLQRVRPVMLDKVVMDSYHALIDEVIYDQINHSVSWWDKAKQQRCERNLPVHITPKYILIVNDTLVITEKGEGPTFILSHDMCREFAWGEIYFVAALDDSVIVERSLGQGYSLARLSLTDGAVIWSLELGACYSKYCALEQKLYLESKDARRITSVDISTGSLGDEAILAEMQTSGLWQHRYRHSWDKDGRQCILDLATGTKIEFYIDAYAPTGVRYHQGVFDDARLLLVFEEIGKGEGWVRLYQVPSGLLLGKARFCDPSLDFAFIWGYAQGHIFSLIRCQGEVSARLISFSLDELASGELNYNDVEASYVQVHPHLLKSSYDLQLSLALASFTDQLRHLTAYLYELIHHWYERQLSWYEEQLPPLDGRRFSGKISLDCSGQDWDDNQHQMLLQMFAHFQAEFKLRDAPVYNEKKQTYNLKLIRNGNRWDNSYRPLIY
ncbi:hypothetical protein [Motilimonas sp. KMU-193]|uniref:hypothetical protein n=1 Tax=Motilimonas sp. KMU-193 TaxID=3388668 RepID=UPI00396B0030